MKWLKSSCGAGGAGITGLLQNEEAYQRWIECAAERAKFYSATMEMCGFTQDGDSHRSGVHRETLPNEIKKTEAAVQRTMSAIEGFMNPWTVDDKERLYILSSGAPVSKEVEYDVLRADEVGRRAKEQFMQERIYKMADETKDFFDKIPKQKLKTMSHTNKIVKFNIH